MSYYDLGGTYRLCQPEETITKLNSIYKKIGITRIADITRLDHIGIPVMTCIRPTANHISVSQGKGITPILAKVSAIMESVESYHAEHPLGSELEGTYTDLKKNYVLIHPKEFQKNYCKATGLDQKKLHWKKAKELCQNKTCYIPQIVTNFNTSYLNPDYAYFESNSNGLAAGNTLSEALMHGLFEIIERYSVIQWYQSNEKNSQLDITSIHSSINQSLLKKYANANMEITIWDVSHVLGIPVYITMINDNDPIRHLGPFYGSGAHLVKEIALARSLTEAAQSRLTYINGARDDTFPYFYELQKTKEPIVINSAQSIPYQNTPQASIPKTIEGINQYVIECLKQKGIKKIIVVDQTREELNIPVSHVFIPQLSVKIL